MNKYYIFYVMHITIEATGILRTIVLMIARITGIEYEEDVPIKRNALTNNMPSFTENFINILDNNSIQTLRNFSVTPPLKLLLKNSLFSSINEYILSQQKRYDELNYVCISLSGGVDSMVIAYICSMLHKLNPESYPFNVVALHVNYSNRKESNDEARFVEIFCSQLNIIFHKMTIDEMTRGKIARDIYEEETRNIRYGFYKEMTTKYNLKGILVGHHAGDVVENVFTNMMKGRTLIDICVMHPENIVNGVNIWRPMLHHFKEDVFDFAHEYGIPYFKDTTPEWSNRGIMRNELFPQLDKQYGVVFRNNLYRIGMQANEEGGIFKEKILNPFLLNNVVYGKFAVYINLEGFNSYGNFFWSTVMLDILHKRSVPMITNGSLSLLVEGIHSGRDHCINLSKNLFGYIKETDLFITFGNFARCIPSKRCLECDNTTEQGWEITLKKVEFDQYKEINLNDFLNGIIIYSYPIDKSDKNHNEIFGKVKKDFRQIVKIYPSKLIKSIPLIIPTKMTKACESNDIILIKLEYNA